MSNIEQEPLIRRGFFVSLFGSLINRKPEGSALFREQLSDAVREGVVDSQMSGMIEGVLRVNEMRVREVMIPFPEMKVFQTSTPLKEVVNEVIKTQHSRYPVMSGDKIAGILFSKDLLASIWQSNKDIELEKMVRDAKIVPEGQFLDKLLSEFKDSKQHMAIVVDEHNEIAGLVTIEDVLEQIVGDIEDEHDPMKGIWILNHGNQYTAKGLTPLAKFREQIGFDFKSDSDTVAGLLFERFERFPEQGEKIEFDGYQFRIVKVDGRRIQLVSVKKTNR